MGEQHLHRTRPRAWLAGVLAVASVVLAACSTPSAPGAGSRQASTTPAVPANSGPQVGEGGQVTVAVSWAGASARPGGRAIVEFTPTAGTYEFVCSIPGHKEAGMRGTLRVV